MNALILLGSKGGSGRTASPFPTQIGLMNFSLPFSNLAKLLDNLPETVRVFLDYPASFVQARLMRLRY